MVTYYIAAILGWFLVTLGVFVLVKTAQMKKIVKDVTAHVGVFFVFAVITFIIGLVMVVTHNYWVLGWPLVVTLLSWLILINGLFRLFFAQYAIRAANSFVASPLRLRITGGIMGLIGLFLLYKVYIIFFI